MSAVKRMENGKRKSRRILTSIIVFAFVMVCFSPLTSAITETTDITLPFVDLNYQEGDPPVTNLDLEIYREEYMIYYENIGEFWNHNTQQYENHDGDVAWGVEIIPIHYFDHGDGSANFKYIIHISGYTNPSYTVNNGLNVQTPLDINKIWVEMDYDTLPTFTGKTSTILSCESNGLYWYVDEGGNLNQREGEYSTDDIDTWLAEYRSRLELKDVGEDTIDALQTALSMASFYVSGFPSFTIVSMMYNWITSTAGESNPDFDAGDYNEEDGTWDNDWNFGRTHHPEFPHEDATPEDWLLTSTDVFYCVENTIPTDSDDYGFNLMASIEFDDYTNQVAGPWLDDVSFHITPSRLDVWNQPPSALALKPSPQAGSSSTYADTGQTVNFNVKNGQGEDREGNTIWYKWNFGDGQNSGESTSASASHQYSNPGTYYPTLMVKDAYHEKTYTKYWYDGVGVDYDIWPDLEITIVQAQDPTIDPKQSSYGWYTAPPYASPNRVLINVDFIANSYSYLSHATYQIIYGDSSGPEGYDDGTGKSAIYTIFDTPCAQYTTDWPIEWEKLDEGFNYLNINVYTTTGKSNSLWYTDPGGVTIRKDTAPPGTPTLLSPSDGKSFTVTSVTLDWSTCYDTQGGSGMKHYVVYFSNNKGDSTSWTTTASQYTVGSLSYSTTYYWQVRAVDNAGNYATSGTRSFSVYAPTVYGALSGYVCNSGTTTGIPGATVDYYYSPAGIPDSGETLKGAESDGNIVSTTTDASGYYVIYNVPVGYHDFYAGASGYNTLYAYDVYVPETGASRNFYLSSSTSNDDGDSSCFASGTGIATPDGDVDIEHISTGDTVISFNELTGAIEPKRVYHTTVHADHPGYLLINGHLKVTANHLIYTSEGPVEAGNLTLGDLLLTRTGTEPVASIVEILDRVTVYNIEVEDNHNYFAEGILVHNKGPEDPGVGGWCPFVYIWNGTNYVEQNNVLPESTNYARDTLDVVDYYIFDESLVEDNSVYRIQLGENWTERTNFDELQLITIDYPSNYTGLIDIGEDGQIETANITIAPEYALDNEWGDQLWMVGNSDNISYEGLWNDTLTMHFEVGHDFVNPKLVVRHKTDVLLVKPNIYYPNPLDDPDLKCSIHVQYYNNGWVDVATIPARVNWVTDIVNLSSVSDYLKLGGEIRFYITGRHYIDYIGLDVSDEQVQCDICYLAPISAQYVGIDNAEMVSRILVSDGNYLQMNPGQKINVSFPYIPHESVCRVFALMVSGHYYTIPMLDIVQPVIIEATVTGSSTGNITILLEEVIGSNIYHSIIGQTFDLSEGNVAIITFNQDAEKHYMLDVIFDNCAIGTAVAITINSLRGAQTLEFINYDNSAKYSLLDDALWNVTGVKFSPLSGRYQVLKNTLLRLETSDDYNWNLTDCDSWNWNFGDGTWTNDICPTHSYENLGVFVLNLTLSNSTYNWSYSIGLLIEVLEEPPIPIIDVYQVVNLTFTISGRKDNTVGVRIYEDGTLIQFYNVTRTLGLPNTLTFELNKYLGKTYSIELVYDADHKGTNPTWLSFTSGEATLMFSKIFNTNDGYYQIISVPTSYLDTVFTNNPSYWFDASGCYDLDGEIVSYNWDFGDNSTSEGIFAEHTYSEPGLYTVTLTITDDDGAIAREMLVIEVCQT